ncbi:hypothetical protein ACPOL_4860 [Acidisarcina polymorpha]|uniref:Uncharacterized protein n=1 Tax=Acidisarcina polymorpha TaxID=2211140 RepID=A0A2Z5G4P5_9BACT|nr:hypothetical protein ACPOL_4860 [Acidisarcina polymorpha]
MAATRQQQNGGAQNRNTPPAMNQLQRSPMLTALQIEPSP